MNADRHLLLGLLALRTGLIQQAQLVAAFHAWTCDKSRSLADHLVALGHLDAARRSALETLAELHVEAHGGDVARSLAVIPTGRSTRESLAGLGDPAIDATIAHVGSGEESTDLGNADADRTSSYVVGTATSGGQRFRVLRPHAKGGLGAVFVALDEEVRREVALKRILTSTPTTRPAARASCSRRRSLADLSIRASSRSTASAPTTAAVPTTPCGSSAVIASRRRSSGSTPATRQKPTPARGRSSCASCCDASPTCAMQSNTPHSRGVLHRDIKPGNVIVGKHGETLVVDWGLAKATGQALPGNEERTLVPSSAGGSAETLAGSALGTPGYMSPEQARGDLESLGPRSDVFSLGATLYGLLTGRPPFEGDDLGAVIRAAQTGEFLPPKRVDPSIDAALEAVCQKAMAHRPEDRYGSARALAEDLERWAADEPVTACASRSVVASAGGRAGAGRRWPSPPWRWLRRRSAWVYSPWCRPTRATGSAA